jgi:hypothetical protein
VQWTDDDGDVTYFGDDMVWDATLGEWEAGLLSGSSSTRKVGSGSDHIYFFFANSPTFYRTVESVTVGGLSNVSFTFWDSTMITTAHLAGSGPTENEVVGIVPVPGSKARR